MGRMGWKCPRAEGRGREGGSITTPRHPHLSAGRREVEGEGGERGEREEREETEEREEPTDEVVEEKVV